MAAEPRAPAGPGAEDAPRLIKILHSGGGHPKAGFLVLDLERTPPVVLEALAATEAPAQTLRWRERRLLLAWLQTGAFAAALAPAGFAVARGAVALAVKGQLVELFNGTAHCRVLFRRAFTAAAEPPPLLVLLPPKAAPKAPSASSLPEPELPAEGPGLSSALRPPPTAGRPPRPPGSPLQLPTARYEAQYEARREAQNEARREKAGGPRPARGGRPRLPGAPKPSAPPARAAPPKPSGPPLGPRRGFSAGGIWALGPGEACGSPEAAKGVCAALHALRAAAQLRPAPAVRRLSPPALPLPPPPLAPAGAPRAEPPAGAGAAGAGAAGAGL